MIKASDVRLGTTPVTAIDTNEIDNILSLQHLKDEHRVRNAVENTKWTEARDFAYYRLDGPDGWLNRAILSQKWLGYVDGFDDYIEIPLPPLISLDSVEYRHESTGVWTTLADTVYGVDDSHLFARIYLKKDQGWPDIYTEPSSVRFTFTAGWVDGAAVLTNQYNIRKAIKLLAGHYFYNPTPTFVEPRLVEVPRKIHFGLLHTIGQYRIVNDQS